MSKKKKEQNPNSAPLRSRTFTLELYPEWSYFNDIISHITSGKYALILHDKDIKNEETGELKKEHVHVVLKYGGRRTLSSVQNEYKIFGLEKRFCDTCNERAMLRYLIHLDDPDKYQYSKDEVDTNMKNDCESAWNDEITSDEAFLSLNEYINESEYQITQAELNFYAIKNGLLRGLKAYGSQINAARLEKNKSIQMKQDEEMIIDRTRAQVKKAIDTGIEKSTALLKTITDVADITGIEYFEFGGQKYCIQNMGDSKPKVKEDLFDEQIDMLKESRKEGK